MINNAHNLTLRPIWIVAFAGHRPGSGPGRSEQELAVCRDAIAAELKSLDGLAGRHNGSVELVTSISSGADIHACEAARSANIPIHCVLPMPLEVFRDDFGERHEGFFPIALDIINSVEEGGGSVRVAPGDHRRPDCYHEANQFMLKIADCLLCVYNGELESGVGGTGEIVAEARRRGVPVIQIDPSKSGSVERFAGHQNWPEAPALVDELNSDLASAAAAHVTGSETTGPQEYQDALDACAIGAATHYRTRLKQSLGLHFGAALLAAMTASLSPVLYYRSEKHAGKLLEPVLEHASTAITGIELGMVIWAYILILQAHRAHTKGVWRRTRLAAERARGLLTIAGVLDPLQPIVQGRQSGWHRFVLSFGLYAQKHADRSAALEDLVSSYAEKRVNNQLDHFSMQVPSSRRVMIPLSKIAWFTTTFAPIVIFIAFMIKLIDPYAAKSTYSGGMLAMFLPIAFPLIAGAMTSYLVAVDAGRRIDRYSDLAERLRITLRDLKGVRTKGAFRQLARETEEMLVAEQVEWSFASKHLGH